LKIKQKQNKGVFFSQSREILSRILLKVIKFRTYALTVTLS